MSLTRAQACTLDDRFGLLGLKTHIQLQAINVAVEPFRGVCDLGVGVPLQETGISWNKVR